MERSANTWMKSKGARHWRQYRSPCVQGQSPCDGKALPKEDRSSLLVVDSILRHIKPGQKLCLTGNHCHSPSSSLAWISDLVQGLKAAENVYHQFRVVLPF